MLSTKSGAFLSSQGYYKQAMKYVSQILHLWLLILLYVLLLITLLTVDPFNSPLPLVIVPFVLLFFALSASFLRILRIMPGTRSFSGNKRLFLAAGAAWLPVMLLILRSVDQLGLRDAIILTVFIIALLLYIGRTNLRRR